MLLPALDFYFFSLYHICEHILSARYARQGGFMKLHWIAFRFAALLTITLLPILISPADAQLLPEIISSPQIYSIEGPSVSPLVRWYTIPGATKYELQISPDPNFSTTILVDTSVSDTTYSVEFLPPDTGYFCRVRVFPAAATVAWSEPVRFYTLLLRNVFTLNFDAGWNFISLPFEMPAAERNFLFPPPCSRLLFCFAGGWGCCPGYPLWERNGFFIKYPRPGIIGVTGIPLVKDTQSVNTGWNIVGSLFRPFPVSSVTTDPPGAITSHFFSYNGSRYVVADTIEPFKAYWVKAREAGNVIYSLPSTPPGKIRAFVHWQGTGIAGIQVALLETKDTLLTDSTGHAEFSVPSGRYTLRAFGINRGGPLSLFLDFDIVVFPGETTDVDIVDCLPCL